MFPCLVLIVILSPFLLSNLIPPSFLPLSVFLYLPFSLPLFPFLTVNPINSVSLNRGM